jgi:hypothetical protein
MKTLPFVFAMFSLALVAEAVEVVVAAVSLVTPEVRNACRGSPDCRNTVSSPGIRAWLGGFRSASQVSS